MSRSAAGGCTQPPLEPHRSARRGSPRVRTVPRADRDELALPCSGFRVVIAHQRSGRVVVEIRDQFNALVGVTSAAPIGATHITYAARGDDWSIAYGQLAEWESGPTVWFGRRGWRGLRAKVRATPLLVGRFWIAEAPARATRVEVRASGSRLGSGRVARSSRSHF